MYVSVYQLVHLIFPLMDHIIVEENATSERYFIYACVIDFISINPFFALHISFLILLLLRSR